MSSRLRLPLLLLACLLSSSAIADASTRGVLRDLAPSGYCAGADNANAPREVQLRALRCLTNYARRVEHRPPLSDSARLDEVAALKARDEFRCNSYSHFACGRNPVYWFHRAGVYCPAYSCSENLAWADAGVGTPRSVMQMWLLSPDHRQGLLDPLMTQQGEGFSCGTIEGQPQVCIYAADFRGHPHP